MELEDKITLANGRELEAYPKGKSEVAVFSGTDYFIKHAFFFFEHADRILHDSRMYLAPIDAKSNLTLGAYIEWWLRVTNWDNGRRPESLSFKDVNRGCIRICPDGSFEKRDYYGFDRNWMRLHSMATYCAKMTGKYEAYSLEDVYVRLSQESRNDMPYVPTGYLVLQDEYERLLKENESTNKNLKFMSRLFGDLCCLHYRDKLEAIRILYQEQQNVRDKENAYQSSHRTELKAMLKKGQLDNIAYQRFIKEMREHAEAIDRHFNRVIEEKKEEIAKEKFMSHWAITQYLNKKVK